MIKKKEKQIHHSKNVIILSDTWMLQLHISQIEDAFSSVLPGLTSLADVHMFILNPFFQNLNFFGMLFGHVSVSCIVFDLKLNETSFKMIRMRLDGIICQY